MDSSFARYLNVALIAGVCATLGAPALGQISTPPPEKPVLPEEFKLNIPFAPNNVRDLNRPATGTPRATPKPPPDVKYDKLAVVDPATGKFKALGQPSEWAAVEKNPMVTPEEMTKINAFRETRAKTYEQLLIQQLNVVDQVQSGIMEGADPNNKAGFGGIMALIKPLMAPAAPAAFPSALQAAGLLTEDQASLSRKIANEYAFEVAAGPELVKEGKRGRPEKSMVEVLKQRLEEPLEIYHRLQVEGLGKIDAILPAAVTDAAKASEIQALAKGASAAKTREAKVALMTQIEKKMDVAERQAFYKALIAGRPAQ